MMMFKYGFFLSMNVSVFPPIHEHIDSVFFNMRLDQQKSIEKVYTFMFVYILNNKQPACCVRGFTQDFFHSIP